MHFALRTAAASPAPPDVAPVAVDAARPSTLFREDAVCPLYLHRLRLAAPARRGTVPLAAAAAVPLYDPRRNEVVVEVVKLDNTSHSVGGRRDAADTNTKRKTETG